MIHQEFHDGGLSGDGRAMQRRAAAPPRVAGNFRCQFRHVFRWVEQQVSGIALHRKFAEIGRRVDVVIELQREFYGLQPFSFRHAGERPRRFAFPVIEPGRLP